jgi:hypothetical protein
MCNLIVLGKVFKDVLLRNRQQTQKRCRK